MASGDLALGIAWFALGFAVYAFLFAAAAALVDKVTEASAAVAPVTTVLVLGYLLSIIVVTGNPSSAWSTAISLFPLSAPLAMPVRWSGGEVPGWQLVTAMVLLSPTSIKTHFCVLLLPAAFCAADFLYRRRDPVVGAALALTFVLGTLTVKGLVGREAGDWIMTYGSVTGCAVVLFVATGRVLLQRSRKAVGVTETTLARPEQPLAA